MNPQYQPNPVLNILAKNLGLNTKGRGRKPPFFNLHVAEGKNLVAPQGVV